MRAIVLLVAALALNSRAETVPFVGCKSGGMVETDAAPTGKSRDLPIAKADAQRLAYYAMSGGVGILAPRDWNCYGFAGSGGMGLMVSENPIDSMKFFSSHWDGLTGLRFTSCSALATHLADTRS